MKEKMGSLPVTAAALVCALLGLSLRAAGRSGGAGALIAVSACVTLAAAVYALLAQKERDYACVFEKSLFDAAASCLGALLIGVGCAIEGLNGAGAGRYIAVLPEAHKPLLHQLRRHCRFPGAAPLGRHRRRAEQGV